MSRTSSRFQPLARTVLRAQSDERLVALARQGKEAAFEEIVRRYRPGLVAFAAAYGPPDPEDVVQESLTRSWKALRDSDTEMHLKAWLYTIVRNRALNAKRDNRSHEPLSEQIDGMRQPAEIALTNEELQRTVAAVKALPTEQREALVRSALDGHTHEQIATSIGSTPGAVRQSIFRARLAVRHGVGAVIPFPLVSALADLGAGGAAASAGGAAAASGGTVAGGGAAGIAGGGSLVAKAAIVATVGALATGSGVAIERAMRDSSERTGPDPARTAQPAVAGATTKAPADVGAQVVPASADAGTKDNATAPGSGEGEGQGSDDGGGSAAGHGPSQASTTSSGVDSGSSNASEDDDSDHGSSGPGGSDDSSGSDDTESDEPEFDDSSGTDHAEVIELEPTEPENLSYDSDLSGPGGRHEADPEDLLE